MEVVQGQIVASRAGRDKTKFYMVARIEQERVWLVDGRKRPLQAPKSKNIRHIAPTKTVLSAGQCETDTAIQAALAAFDKGEAKMTGG